MHYTLAGFYTQRRMDDIPHLRFIIVAGLLLGNFRMIVPVLYQATVTACDLPIEIPQLRQRRKQTLLVLLFTFFLSTPRQGVQRQS